ncbi:dihydrodipicolinate synthase family protein [Leifsonia sp. F6_8S_P_1B]|uniref:Dihydrodipicolinate synthase family protein n=1 Tax=Leifsonia williamsii TaxID=3035919 RepID=A0ABT8KAY9_9MICO|nr:dihydrodipicolinate synthase family protein [Leifsonia williamsii]MDN4614591.1 dihydrodipicolinate synthase family protein [Leifsonia williamsii]
MDRNSVDWHGYIPAITTPFTREGAFDREAFAGQLGWLADEGMHGVILAGTSGEWFSLSADERAELFASGARHGSGMTVIGGCNAFTAAEAIQHARAAEKAGLDGILLTPPPYMVPTKAEIVEFYREVSDATELPICVYNWPRGCIVDMGVDTLAELAELDNVVAIKNSTGDFAAFLAGLYALGDRVRYFGIPTSEIGADLVQGGHGDGLMGSGAPLGRDHPDFWNALAAGDRERAIALGARDRVIMTSWFGADYGAKFGNQQAIMKTALRLRGVPAGYVRRPLLELDEEQVALVRTTLEGLGIGTVPLS